MPRFTASRRRVMRVLTWASLLFAAARLRPKEVSLNPDLGRHLLLAPRSRRHRAEHLALDDLVALVHAGHDRRRHEVAGGGQLGPDRHVVRLDRSHK
jgi:hypothetical protein